MTKLIIQEMYFVKSNVNIYELFEMNYLLSLFFLKKLTPVYSNLYILE